MIDQFFTSSLTSKPSNALIYITMANPFVFVSLIFMLLRKTIIKQNEKIKDLEEKIKNI